MQRDEHWLKASHTAVEFAFGTQQVLEQQVVEQDVPSQVHALPTQ
jgi:hypothetical protein